MICSLIASLIHSFMPSHVHSFLPFFLSFIHSFIALQSFIMSFIQSFIHSFTQSLTHSLIDSFTYSFTYLVSHSAMIVSVDSFHVFPLASSSICSFSGAPLKMFIASASRKHSNRPLVSYIHWSSSKLLPRHGRPLSRIFFICVIIV